MTRKMTKMKFAKTDTRYWERKVGFQTPASRTFSVQIQHANRRMIIGLGTANRAQAAFEARQLYVALKANGWDETMRRRRGDVAEKKCDVTIGEYVEAVREKSLLRPATIESYAVALRMIAGAITGRESKAHRDAIKLRSITDDKVEAWRACLHQAQGREPARREERPHHREQPDLARQGALLRRHCGAGSRRRRGPRPCSLRQRQG